MKLIDWYVNTKRISNRIISVVSKKRFPTSGRVTMIWWDTYGVKSFCGEYHEVLLLYGITCTYAAEGIMMEKIK